MATKNSQKSVGFYGANVFVVIENEIFYVPTRDLLGKSEEQVKNLITANIVKAMLSVDVSTKELANKLEQNLGDLNKAIEQIAHQAGDKVKVLYTSEQLSLVFDVAERFEQGVSSDKVSQAVVIWDSLSPEAKQSMVDEANAANVRGCGSSSSPCTLDGAEGFVDRIR